MTVKSAAEVLAILDQHDVFEKESAARQLAVVDGFIDGVETLAKQAGLTRQGHAKMWVNIIGQLEKSAAPNQLYGGDNSTHGVSPEQQLRTLQKTKINPVKPLPTGVAGNTLSGLPAVLGEQIAKGVSLPSQLSGGSSSGAVADALKAKALVNQIKAKQPTPAAIDENTAGLSVDDKSMSDKPVYDAGTGEPKAPANAGDVQSKWRADQADADKFTQENLTNFANGPQKIPGSGGYNWGAPAGGAIAGSLAAALMTALGSGDEQGKKHYLRNILLGLVGGGVAGAAYPHIRNAFTGQGAGSVA